MLTADQIAEFERRAAEAEKPRHPGWQWNPMNRPFFNCDGAWELCHLRVYPSTEKRSDKPTAFYLTDIRMVRGWHDFSSLAAAQLAAEHLLMEATRPLVEAQMKALEDALSEYASYLVASTRPVDAGNNQTKETER